MRGDHPSILSDRRCSKLLLTPQKSGRGGKKQAKKMFQILHDVQTHWFCFSLQCLLWIINSKAHAHPVHNILKEAANNRRKGGWRLLSNRSLLHHTALWWGDVLMNGHVGCQSECWQEVAIIPARHANLLAPLCKETGGEDSLPPWIWHHAKQNKANLAATSLHEFSLATWSTYHGLIIRNYDNWSIWAVPYKERLLSFPLPMPTQPWNTISSHLPW